MDVSGVGVTEVDDVGVDDVGVLAEIDVGVVLFPSSSSSYELVF